MLSKSQFGKSRVEDLQRTIDKILSMWDSNTVEEIAEELEIPKQKVSYYMGQLRKKGVNIPKKLSANSDTIWNDVVAKYKLKYGELPIKKEAK